MKVPYIQGLLGDHAVMRQVLNALEREFDRFSEGKQPDFALIEDIAVYCRDYPDLIHHPKEDLVYEQMRAKDPERAEGAGDLVAQHRQLVEKTRHFVAVATAVEREAGMSRDEAFGVVHDFILLYRQHMAMEEEFFFPAARLMLGPADWRTLRTLPVDRHDPLLGDRVEERYRRLREEIFAWDKEDREQP